MTNKKDITIENKLLTEKRSINVYQHAARGAHLLSSNGLISLPLEPSAAGDYLHISATRGPGRIKKECVIEIPLWLDFEFSGEGKVLISHKADRLIVTIPPGPPAWQLKLTRPDNAPPGGLSAAGNQKITVGEL